jgi:hypothetical protein
MPRSEPKPVFLFPEDEAAYYRPENHNLPPEIVKLVKTLARIAVDEQIQREREFTASGAWRRRSFSPPDPA